MSPTDRLIQDALSLPDGERARLAKELLASLEPPGPEPDRTDEEWIAEIERRARDALSGASPGRPWADVRRRIEERLAGR